MPQKSICVFAGASLGADPGFAKAAGALGAGIAGRGHAVVYGGSSFGLMGVVADSALSSGGRVVGVMPDLLMLKEAAHRGLSDFRVSSSLHERKQMMAELADGFVALPGGFGTLDELFDILTWAQLGLHAKPCAVLNVNGFFDPLLIFLDSCVDNGLLRPENRAIVFTAPDTRAALDYLERSFQLRPVHDDFRI